MTLRGQSGRGADVHLYTATPLPTHFWGLMINDLGLTWDKTSTTYGEAQGIPHAPVGLYDFNGQLVDTVHTDYNGYYEALEPSTYNYNCPTAVGSVRGHVPVRGQRPRAAGRAERGLQPAVPHDRGKLPGRCLACST